MRANIILLFSESDSPLHLLSANHFVHFPLDHTLRLQSVLTSCQRAMYRLIFYHLFIGVCPLTRSFFVTLTPTGHHGGDCGL